MNSNQSVLALVQPEPSAYPTEEIAAAVATPAVRTAAFKFDPYVAEFETSAAARNALEDRQLLAINIDVQDVAPAVIHAAHNISSLRADIVKQLPYFDIARFDALIPLTQSLAYAHTLYLAATTPLQELPRLFARAVELREILLLDVTLLVKRRLLTGVPFDDLKGPVGYTNVATDLRVLTNICQANWEAIAGKTAVQTEELDEAAQLFCQMTDAVAERSRQPAMVEAARNQRARAYTLVLLAYQDVRRAVTYVRSAQGDAEKLAPSLWKGRGGRRGHVDGGEVVPSEPAPSPVVNGVGPMKMPVVAPGILGGSRLIDG